MLIFLIICTLPLFKEDTKVYEPVIKTVDNFEISIKLNYKTKLYHILSDIKSDYLTFEQYSQ